MFNLQGGSSTPNLFNLFFSPNESRLISFDVNVSRLWPVLIETGVCINTSTINAINARAQVK